MDVLTALFEYLVEQAIVRDPSVESELPPLWVEPGELPAPGEPEGAVGAAAVEVHPDLVIGAYKATPIPSRRQESFRHFDGVDLTFRSRRPEFAHDCWDRIDRELHDRRHFTMGGDLVIESRVFKGLQRLGADRQGWLHTAEVTIEWWDL